MIGNVNRFVNVMRSRLEKERALIVEDLVAGRASDYARYRELVGQIAGIDLSLAQIRETFELPDRNTERREDQEEDDVA